MISDQINYFKAKFKPTNFQGSSQSTRNSFEAPRTFCPANLHSFTGHFEFSPDISLSKCPASIKCFAGHLFIGHCLDLPSPDKMSGEIKPLRRAFSKFAGHVRRISCTLTLLLPRVIYTKLFPHHKFLTSPLEVLVKPKSIKRLNLMTRISIFRV